MRIDPDVKLDFDDVLIKPKRSEAPSRRDVDLEREYTFLNSGATWYGIPILASNMDTIGTFEMAESLSLYSMPTCLHKYYSNEDLVEFLNNLFVSHTFMTIGIHQEDLDKLEFVYNNIRLKYLCIDVANGYTQFFVDSVKHVRELYPSLTIMAGNVATPEMVQELLISGAADIVKIGIGPGSVCTTRMKTGVGYPQLSTIIECADAAHGLKGHVCADGGCRKEADVVKAFAAGADFVMLGGMLAGHDECGGIFVDGEMRFYGMASKIAMDKYSGGQKDYRAAEGTATLVPAKGPIEETLQEITGGLRSACTLVGASCLKDLSKCTTFVLCNRQH